MAIHPLEPLSAFEVERAAQILKVHPSFTPTTRITSIALEEPTKQQVYAWHPGDIPARKAEAVLFGNKENRGSHASLDLTTATAVSVRLMPAGAQPILSVDEQTECEAAVIASPVFVTRLSGTAVPVTRRLSWLISGAPATTATTRIRRAVSHDRSAFFAAIPARWLCPSDRRHSAGGRP